MTRPDPLQIIVPRKHGEVLIEPPLARLQRAVEDSQWHFSDLRHDTLRRAARIEFHALATTWSRQIGTDSPPACDGPFILTGHQVEFYHGGVWAKVVAADELAKRTGGIAFDLLVDHDLADHQGFDVPVHSANGMWSRKAVEFAPPSPLPVESLPAPSLEAFLNWDADLAIHTTTQTDSLAFFLSALRHSDHPAKTYADWMSRARARFEASLDLRVWHVPTSLLCTTDSWRIFVGAWIQNADVWTLAYNRHLGAYRHRQGIKNLQHPMPDLVRTTDPDGAQIFELPFWISRPGQPRERLLLRKRGEGIAFLIDDFEHVLKAGIGQWSTLIRPRALTLTMFTRLFVADLFIHGIGGALYDQVTNDLMQELFGIVPPYACVSAAWLLPMGQTAETGEEISDLIWQRHHVLHNPQIAIDPFTALRTDVAEMIRDRKLLVEQIAGSLKAARRDSAARRQRRDWFDALHAINSGLHGKAPNLLGNLDRQIGDAQRTAAQKKVLLWREYFFALHTTSSLKKLIGKIKNS